MKSSAPSKENLQTESEYGNKFNKSLQDLNDLCSQLHHAAESYQSTFLKSKQKQLVVKNTKEYIRSALVTVVDHLRSVSANLDQQLCSASSICQTDKKLRLLNQKLLTCQDYSHKIALAKVTEWKNNPKFNSRYIRPPISDVQNMNEDDEVIVDEEVPLFLYTCSCYKPASLLEGSTVPVLPVKDNLSVQPKSQDFQLQDKGKGRRGGMLFLKSRSDSEILSVSGSRRM